MKVFTSNSARRKQQPTLQPTSYDDNNDEEEEEKSLIEFKNNNKKSTVSANNNNNESSRISRRPVSAMSTLSSISSNTSTTTAASSPRFSPLNSTSSSLAATPSHSNLKSPSFLLQSPPPFSPPTSSVTRPASSKTRNYLDYKNSLSTLATVTETGEPVQLVQKGVILNRVSLFDRRGLSSAGSTRTTFSSPSSRSTVTTTTSITATSSAAATSRSTLLPSRVPSAKSTTSSTSSANSSRINQLLPSSSGRTTRRSRSLNPRDRFEYFEEDEEENGVTNDDEDEEEKENLKSDTKMSSLTGMVNQRFKICWDRLSNASPEPRTASSLSTASPFSPLTPTPSLVSASSSASPFPRGFDDLQSEFGNGIDEIEDMIEDMKTSVSPPSRVSLLHESNSKSLFLSQRNQMKKYSQQQQQQKIKRKKQENDDDDDDENEDEEGEESDKKNASSQPKFKSLQKRMEERMKELVENPAAYAELEDRISKYEEKVKNEKQKKEEEEGGSSISRDLVKINMDHAKNSEFMKAHSKEWAVEHERRIKLAIAKKHEIDADQVKKKKEAIAQRQLQREKLAEERMQMIRAKMFQVVVSQASRAAVLDRIWNEVVLFVRREKARKRFENLVRCKLMFIVARRRRRRVREAWKTFKKYWTIYRLWIPTKRKIEAITIIRSLLKNSMRFYQITHFGEKVLKCQRLIRRHLNKRYHQQLVLCLKYSRIEEMMLRGEKIGGKKKLEKSKKKEVQQSKGEDEDESGVIMNKSSSSSLNESRFSSKSKKGKDSKKATPKKSNKPSKQPQQRQSQQQQQQQKKKKITRESSFLTSLDEEEEEEETEQVEDTEQQQEGEGEKQIGENNPYHTFVFSKGNPRFERLTLGMRKEIIAKNLIERRERFRREYLAWTRAMKEYRKIEQAIQSGEPNSIFITLPRKPREPYFRVIMSDEEMQELCELGFSKLRELEAYHRQYASSMLPAGSKRDKFLVLVEQEHRNRVEKSDEFLRKYFVSSLQDQLTEWRKAVTDKKNAEGMREEDEVEGNEKGGDGAEEIGGRKEVRRIFEEAHEKSLMSLRDMM